MSDLFKPANQAKVDPLKVEGREMAQELARYAVSLKAEGRMVWTRIEEASRIMRELAK